MTVVGTGFPNDVSTLSKFTIKIGDVTLPASNVQSVTTTQLKF